MNNKIKILGTALILTGILFACSESFLDGPAQGVLDQSTLGNASGVEGNLISTYSVLDGYAGYGGWGGAGSNWIFGSAGSDDSYKGSEAGDQQPTQDVEMFQWSTAGADEYLGNKWDVVYDGVARANSTINLMRDVMETTPGEISDADAKRIEGEAIFLRAHYHFEAWKFWGNIPYYTELDTDFKKANMTSTEVMSSILADLDAAIALLPETQGDVGRVTKWTAKAYKGRVLAFKGDFGAVLTVLKEVETSGPYDLQTTFHDVFDVAHNNGPETVLAYQASVNDGENSGNNGNRNDRLNFPHSGSPFGCCGFHQPSQNLVNVFKVDASGLPFLDGSWNNVDVVLADPVDPRLDWTTGRDDVPFLDWGIHDPGWIRARAWAGPYSPKKTIYEKASGAGSSVGWSNFQLHSMNYHLLRYADVLLMLAEAEVEAGDLNNARALVNQIRERASQSAQGPDGGAVEVDIDDASITWATYSIGLYTTSWTDQTMARKAVRMERRLELAMEGHRLFDLRRWGVLKGVMNEYLTVEKTRREYLKDASEVTDRHMLHPLPINQIELSSVDGVQQLVQNDGW